MPRLQVKIGSNRFETGIAHVNHSGELSFTPFENLNLNSQADSFASFALLALLAPLVSFVLRRQTLRNRQRVLHRKSVGSRQRFCGSDS